MGKEGMLLNCFSHYSWLEGRGVRVQNRVAEGFYNTQRGSIATRLVALSGHERPSHLKDVRFHELSSN